MARRRKGRAINGWLIVDKPKDMTSTHAVGIVKRVLNAQKAGHGGTLDPLATGILPIALGHATKTVPFVMDAQKRYRFTVRFGFATDTDDSDGEPIKTSQARPGDAALEAVLPKYVGTIMQRPPIYAAVKIDGERAYDLARRGEAVEPEPREVRIDSLEMIERVDADHAIFEITSGKGVYVRSLARDIGEELGCFAHISQLRRLAVGAFGEEEAVPLDALRQIVEDETLPQVLVPLNAALAGIPAFALTEPQTQRLLAGQSVRIAPKLLPGDIEDGATVKALSGDEVIALTRLEGIDLKPMRVFANAP